MAHTNDADEKTVVGLSIVTVVRVGGAIKNSREGGLQDRNCSFVKLSLIPARRYGNTLSTQQEYHVNLRTDFAWDKDNLTWRWEKRFEHQKSDENGSAALAS